MDLTGLNSYYTKTEVTSDLALKQNSLRFLGNDRDNGAFRTVADGRTVRSIGGAGPITITESIDLLNGGVNNLRVNLNMGLTGLTNYYTKQEIDSTTNNMTVNIQGLTNSIEGIYTDRINKFTYPSVSGNLRFFKLGRLNLPSDGYHAIIHVNACYGWNIHNDGILNTSYYNMNNFQMTAHIYSLVPWNSRAVDPGSLGTSRGRYIDNNYSIYYNGFVVITSPFVRPPGFYLTLVPSNPKIKSMYACIHRRGTHAL